MQLRIRKEVIPFVVSVLLFCCLFALLTHAWLFSACLGVVGTVYLLYFFRDPERVSPADEESVVAGADGRIAAIRHIQEEKFLRTNTIRISIFLSLFDVHVNRAPIGGKSTFLGYFPGKRFFTFQEKSSELNQHNKILIEGVHTRCLVNQIVGPVCRRVVYWFDHEKPADVKRGQRIGMMKFGSRLDIYLPATDLEILVKMGDTVRAGETVVARLKTNNLKNRSNL